MFERITFRRNVANQESRLDLGKLAEMLLFYKETNLLIDVSILSELLHRVGPDTTQRLVTSQFVKPRFMRHSFAVQSQGSPIKVHNLIEFEAVGNKETGYVKSRRARIQWLFERVLGKSGTTKKAASAFADAVPDQDVNFGSNNGNSITKLAQQDLGNPDYLKAAIEALLQQLLPDFDLPANWHFKSHQFSDGFGIDTNLDFAAMNKLYHKHVSPEHSTLSPAYLLSHVLEARAGLQLSAAYSTDIIVTPTTSKLMEIKLQGIAKAHLKVSEEIKLFQSSTIGSGAAIAQAINSGEKSFDEFLDLLEHAEQFKNWVVQQDTEQHLIGQYLNEVTAKTWAEKLPAKSFRFSFFTGAGLLLDAAFTGGLATGVGVAIGAGDTFLLDKILKGWKPNQFVDGEMSDFVSNS